jgi:hypothetical protein
MKHRKSLSLPSALCAAAVAVAAPFAAFAMPNPASVFCGKMGGRTEIAQLADGSQIGLCFLPDKRIIEEWTFFHMGNRRSSGGSGNPGGLGSMPGSAGPQSR